jgi:hypothetical protein
MRLIRILLKILGALTAMIVVLLLLLLERVNYTPYFDTDYYSRTRARLDSLSNRLEPNEGALEVGFGKASITPGLNAEEDDPVTGEFRELPLAGYGDREGAPAEGIHDSVFVKAIAIRVEEQLLVLIGADILIVPPNVTEGVTRMVQRELGLDRKQLFFSATHTHSGVGAWSEGFVGKEFAGLANPHVVEWLIGQFSRAIALAVEDLQPGKIGSGMFDASGFIRNRLVGERGKVNTDFIYLMVNQINGRKAILGSFDAHATTLSGRNMLISGDYPGFWQRKLEREGADMAVFFAGSVGSHSASSQGESFERARYLGESLADSVLKYMADTPPRDSIEFSFLSLGMDMPELHIRVTDGLRLKPAIGRKLFPPMGDVYFQVARIGDLVWITAPGDFSGEMAVAYKGAMQKEGLKALVTSFNGAYTGYIVPGKYYHMNEYESRLMSWYGPNMGPYSDEIILRMTQRLTQGVEDL